MTGYNGNGHNGNGRPSKANNGLIGRITNFLGLGDGDHNANLPEFIRRLETAGESDIGRVFEVVGKGHYLCIPGGLGIKVLHEDNPYKPSVVLESLKGTQYAIKEYGNNPDNKGWQAVIRRLSKIYFDGEEFVRDSEGELFVIDGQIPLEEWMLNHLIARRDFIFVKKQPTSKRRAGLRL